MKKPLVSIIVPVYNGELYLQECLDSIFAQSLSDYEIIAINDGSTDDSLKILEENAKRYKNLRIIDQSNQGQGRTRNEAIRLAGGTYIQFVDADDWILPETLERSTEIAEATKADVVRYGWRYSDYTDQQLIDYRRANKEPFDGLDVLAGDDCDQLLQIKHYFSTNNLYRKSFLIRHNVKYGDSRLYEDNVFMVLVANRASKIALIHEVLYIYRRNSASTTNSGYHDDRHGAHLIKAIQECRAVLKPRTEFTNYYFIKYFQTKFIRYYTARMPRRYRHQFLKQYVDAMYRFGPVTIPVDAPPERILRMCLKYDVLKRKRYYTFQTMIYYKTKLLPARDRLRDGFLKNKASK